MLTVVPYRVGTGQWRPRWMRTTYDVGLVLFVVFLPWWFVWKVTSGPGVLVLLAMVTLTAAYVFGRRSMIRRR